jgi:hypothetical protein
LNTGTVDKFLSKQLTRTSNLRSCGYRAILVIVLIRVQYILYAHRNTSFMP